MQNEIDSPQKPRTTTPDREAVVDKKSNKWNARKFVRNILITVLGMSAVAWGARESEMGYSADLNAATPDTPSAEVIPVPATPTKEASVPAFGAENSPLELAQPSVNVSTTPEVTETP